MAASNASDSLISLAHELIVSASALKHPTTKVSALVRTFGAADTEIWPAVEWEQFMTIARSMQE